MKQAVIYWICQIAGWLAYILFTLVMMYIFSGMSSFTTGVLILQFVIGISLLLFSHLYRLYIKRKNWSTLKVRQLIPKILVGITIVSVLTQSFIHLLIYFLLPLKGLTPFSWINFLGYTASVSVVMALWSTIYFAYQFIQRNRRTEIEKLELKTALQEAELLILKNQINPHFLFNALNNIRSLILSDPEKARSMVTHISDLLRYSISFNASEKVSLEQELDIVKDYLQLESIQFNNRLRFSFDIDPESLTTRIPPMAIQLLVENAIKHGIAHLSNGGHIGIRSKVSAAFLTVEVCNDGQLKPHGGREGVGLKNLVDRMKILFGQFAELSLKNSSDDKVIASLKIPIP